MSNIVEQMIAELKAKFGNYELTDDDFHESEDVAEYDTDAMFRYFRNELEEDRVAKLLQFASESKLFLHDLIAVGEIVQAEEMESRAAVVPMSWMDFGGLATAAPEARKATLARSQGLIMDVASVHMMAAAGRLEKEYPLPFGAEANVYEDDEQLVIKITSEDTSLDGQLVGFCLSDKDRDRLGFILLRDGLLGAVSGMAQIHRSSISGETILNFNTVDASDLAIADFPLLEAAIESDMDDRRSIDAWRTWIEQVSSSQDGPGLAAGLDRLRAKLA